MAFSTIVILSSITRPPSICNVFPRLHAQNTPTFFLGFTLANLQVKVKTWLDGKNNKTFGGLSARFGALLPSDAEKGQKLTAVMPNPANSCSNSSVKVPLCYLLQKLFLIISLFDSFQLVF